MLTRAELLMFARNPFPNRLSDGDSAVDKLRQVCTWRAWHRLTTIITGSHVVRKTMRLHRGLFQGLPLGMLSRGARYVNWV